MKTIGFDMAAEKNAADLQQETAEKAEGKETDGKGTEKKNPAPVRSLVQVAFDSGQNPLTYYNDRFDLKQGDVVYVEGKMEGRRGHVISLTKTFKIRLSDYKRVIGVADRSVKGRLYFGGSHLISFDRNALPYEKVLTWMKAPESEGTEYVSGSDGETFPLNDLGQMNVSDAVGERGVEYYRQNRVCFLELDGCRGRALVEGTKTYEVEFTCEDGQICGLVCDCPCAYHCKHEVAVMLQLSETLKCIEEKYADEYAESGYFSAVSRELFFDVAATGQEKESIEVEI